MGCCHGRKKADKGKEAASSTALLMQKRVIDNPGRIQDNYDVERRRIGEGSFAQVFKAGSKSTGFTRAVKVCCKKYKRHIPKFHEEIKILQNIDHPHLLKYFESFEDHKYIYIVTEMCEGPEIFDLIVDQGHLTEWQSAVLMSQVFRALTYMHSVNIVHRDLKPENLMLMFEDVPELNTVKIIDFGHATFFKRSKETGKVDPMLSLKCGAPYYVAPQVLAGEYDYMCDIWSAGVLMYIVLCGYPPFLGESDADVLDHVRLGNFEFNEADWNNTSNEAKDLIRKLLKINPQERWDGAQALQSPWITKLCPRDDEVPLKGSLISSFRQYAKANALRKCGLYTIAGTLNIRELKASVDTFNTFDYEGDGSVGFEEISRGLEAAGFQHIPDDLEETILEMDSDGSGQIEYTEFLAATFEKRYLSEDNIWNAFRCFDYNGDGKISQTELYRILNRRTTEGTNTCPKCHGEWDAPEPKGDVCPKCGIKCNREGCNVFTAKDVVKLMKSLDGTSDGFIDFPEFFSMMRGVEYEPTKEDE